MNIYTLINNLKKNIYTDNRWLSVRMPNQKGWKLIFHHFLIYNNQVIHTQWPEYLFIYFLASVWTVCPWIVLVIVMQINHGNFVHFHHHLCRFFLHVSIFCWKKKKRLMVVHAFLVQFQFLSTNSLEFYFSLNFRFFFLFFYSLFLYSLYSFYLLQKIIQ